MSVERAVELGCDSMQIFGRNPRSWRFDPVPSDEVSLFRQKRSFAGIWPVVIHSTYLINLSSPDETNFAKSVELFKNELMTAEELGADYLVTHLGSPHELGEEFARKRVLDALRDVSASTWGRKTMILFENTAGGGSSFGSDLGALGALIRKARGLKLETGLCFDTCHAFAAGYPMATDADIERLLSSIEKEVGIENLKVIHLNDSRGEMGSRLDRHEHIGKGRIGLPAFRLFLNRPEIREVPMILETPKKTPEDDPMNIRVVRGMMKKRKKN